MSAGIGAATGAGNSGGGSSSYTGVPIYDDDDIRGCYGRDGRFYERDFHGYHGIECRAMVFYDGHVVRRRSIAIESSTAPSSPATSRLGFYAGAQKVHESDGSASVELTVTENRFRLHGTFTRYFERLQGGGVLTMSMPSLTAGIRIDDMGATAVFLEGGVVHSRTANDPMQESSITGPIAGMTVEHSLSKKVSLLGDVQQMWFQDDVRATGGRVGVRYRYVQASVRVLDFNVGPALWGPEVGVRF